MDTCSSILELLRLNLFMATELSQSQSENSIARMFNFEVHALCMTFTMVLLNELLQVMLDIIFPLFQIFPRRKGRL